MMDKANRISKSEAARAKRRKLKNILFDCMLRKYAKLRKCRQKRNNK